MKVLAVQALRAVLLASCMRLSAELTALLLGSAQVQHIYQCTRTFADRK
jgi:hypothetical protein